MAIYNFFLLFIIRGNGRKTNSCRRRRRVTRRSIKVMSVTALTPRALYCTIRTKGQPCLLGINRIYVSRSSAFVSLPIPFSPPPPPRPRHTVPTQQLLLPHITLNYNILQQGWPQRSTRAACDGF